MGTVKIQEYTYSQILKRMGYFRVYFNSLIQFNSISFRVTLGFASGVLWEGVALVTALEFILNSALEVPMGYFADRKGRAKSTVLGLILLGLAMLCCFIAIQFSHFLALAWGMLVLQGVLIGIGKPLVSGSVEGFYQSALKNADKPSADKISITNNSLLLSSQFGALVPLLSVSVAFALVLFLLPYGLTHTLFIFGGLLYFPLAHYVYMDLKMLGDNYSFSKGGAKSDVLLFAKKLVMDKNVFLSTIYKTLGLANLCILLGYLPVTLGRELQLNSTASTLVVLASLMFGYFGVGWFLKGKVLTRFVRTSSNNGLISVGPLLLIALYVCALQLIGSDELSLWSAVVFVIGIFTHVVMNGMGDIMTNRTIRDIDSNRLATMMSLQNIPGFLVVGLYSFYVMAFCSGAPSLAESFWSLIAVNFAILGLYLLAENRPWVKGNFSEATAK